MSGKHQVHKLEITFEASVHYRDIYHGHTQTDVYLLQVR